jgi:hypothetical protein
MNRWDIKGSTGGNPATIAANSARNQRWKSRVTDRLLVPGYRNIESDSRACARRG